MIMKYNFEQKMVSKKKAKSKDFCISFLMDDFAFVLLTKLHFASFYLVQQRSSSSCSL